MDTETVTVSAASVEAVLVNADNDVRFRMDIAGVRDETFRVRVREAYPKVPRFEVPHVLDGDPEPTPVEVVDRCVVYMPKSKSRLVSIVNSLYQVS